MSGAVAAVAAAVAATTSLTAGLHPNGASDLVMLLLYALWIASMVVMCVAAVVILDRTPLRAWKRRLVICLGIAAFTFFSSELVMRSDAPTSASVAR